MKRKFFSFLLCICFLLSGCNTGSGEEEPAPAETTTGTSDTAETSTAPEKTEGSVTAETMTNELFLNDIPYGKLNSMALTFNEPALLRYWGDMLREPKNYSFQYRENGMSVRDIVRTREANPVVGFTDEEKAEVYRFAEEGEFLPIQKWSSPYRLSERTDGTELTVGKIEGKSVHVDDFSSGYTVEGKITLRAFVKKADSHQALVIPDPRYLSGLPVFETSPDRMNYELNGLSVALDSFPINTRCYADVMEKLEKREGEYVYAQVTLWTLAVNYSFSSGYNCSAFLGELVPITDDLDAAINGPFLMPEDGKDPEMAAVYTALLENADLLYTENTYGILLLDLDFDGTPEVLRTRCTDDSELRNYRDGSAEIDIYRIENETLRYIDRIESLIYARSSDSRIEAVLGQKTLPDGTKGWYGISDRNFKTKERDGEYCYFYRLDGDTLTVTEIAAFTEEPPADETGGTIYHLSYYGEEQDVQKEVVPESYDGDIVYMDRYTLDGVSAFYPMQFFHSFKEDFSEDISEVYLLFSDWIVPHEIDSFEMEGETRYYHSRLNPDEKKELSLRELSYELAYLVDAFYLGDYSPEGAKYIYLYTTAFAKPVIYLYPEEKTEVSVRVDFTEGGELTCTYPEYGEGWEVTALPDGTIYDKEGNEYYCLYWEGSGSAEFEYGKGWCVAGSDTAAFLREKLLGIGLTAREANEFIIYWLPELQKNPYNLITFHTDDYAKSVPLTVSPIPDTVIRVFMTYEPADTFTEIEPQALPHYEREGFTLVEWGGSPSGEALLQ